MHTESSDHGPGGSRTLERAIVLVLLGDGGERTWSRAELGEGLGVAQAELAKALSGLLETGVLEQRADRLWPSSAARRLDELELIGI
jgi:DNA-binding IclR family transcriptional regulator